MAAKAHAEWNGSLREGHGQMRVGSGAFDVAYSFKTRFEGAPGTNPEELIGAAHAGCFSMALAAGLGKAGHAPEQITTDAEVFLENTGGGFTITRIRLTTVARVPGINDATLHQFAEDAKKNCPVSKALGGVENIELDVKLV
ncbi:MAG TPA: OsmC family protein [Thermoanaerobaculia bacterium]